MNKVLIFVLLGLLFAAPGEVLNQILAQHNVQAFRSTMISYTVLLLIGYFVDKGISSVCKKSRSRLIYYLLFGFLGLLVEWFLLGNAPVLEPFQIITQPGMFTYWGTMLLAPCLMMEPDFAELKKSFARFFASFSLLYLIVGMVVPKDKGGIFFAFILFAGGTTALNYFYMKYFKELARR
jgi:phosphoglycerol transferase MdoB-like AlkP superfamily enzyme